MSAYMIITAELTDPEGFQAYGKASAALIPKFGGQYKVIRPQENILLEGEWPEEKKIVVSKWPSVEAALTFWNSPEYAEVKKLREGKAHVQVRLVSGTS